MPSTGTFSRPSKGRIYVLYNNQFVETQTGNVPNNRGYLLLDETTTSNARRTLSIGGLGNTTSIADTLNDLQQEQWYDLNGNKVNGPQSKGIFIVNGHKVIVKR